MKCQHVTNMFTLNTVLRSTDIDLFKEQYREILSEVQNAFGIAYVWRSEKPIPRLKGASRIVYIGKTKTSLYRRYIRYVDGETEAFWDRYAHILTNFGPIRIEIHETEDPARTENNFLYEYQIRHYETPPLNTQSYKESLLNTRGLGSEK